MLNHLISRYIEATRYGFRMPVKLTILSCPIILQLFQIQIQKTFIQETYTLYRQIKSSPPSAAYMRQGTGPALIQVTACRLFDAKPLPEPMLAYCQLDSCEQISLIFEWHFYHFH